MPITASISNGSYHASAAAEFPDIFGAGDSSEVDSLDHDTPEFDSEDGQLASGSEKPLWVRRSHTAGTVGLFFIATLGLASHIPAIGENQTFLLTLRTLDVRRLFSAPNLVYEAKELREKGKKVSRKQKWQAAKLAAKSIAVLAGMGSTVITAIKIIGWADKDGIGKLDEKLGAVGRWFWVAQQVTFVVNVIELCKTYAEFRSATDQNRKEQLNAKLKKLRVQVLLGAVVVVASGLNFVDSKAASVARSSMLFAVITTNIVRTQMLKKGKGSNLNVLPAAGAEADVVDGPDEGD